MHPSLRLRRRTRRPCGHSKPAEESNIRPARTRPRSATQARDQARSSSRAARRLPHPLHIAVDTGDPKSTGSHEIRDPGVQHLSEDVCHGTHPFEITPSIRALGAKGFSKHQASDICPSSSKSSRAKLYSLSDGAAPGQRPTSTMISSGPLNFSS